MEPAPREGNKGGGKKERPGGNFLLMELGVGGKKHKRRAPNYFNQLEKGRGEENNVKKGMFPQHPGSETINPIEKTLVKKVEKKKRDGEKGSYERLWVHQAHIKLEEAFTQSRGSDGEKKKKTSGAARNAPAKCV